MTELLILLYYALPLLLLHYYCMKHPRRRRLDLSHINIAHVSHAISPLKALKNHITPRH